MIEAAFARLNLSSKNSVFFSVLWCIALGLPLILWLNHTGNPFDYFRYSAPAGQIPYLFSRLFGLYAFSLLIMQVVLKFAKKAGGLPDWRIHAHRNLGMTVLLCAILHAGLFVTAKSIRGGHFAFDTLIPSFDKGYYNSSLTIGLISLGALTNLIFSGFFRIKFLKYNMYFALLHKISALSCILVIYHVLNIGSEV